jgi:predicted TIM-barrel fold metal-dependent hydrolase
MSHTDDRGLLTSQATIGSKAPLTLVSADTHVGLLLVEQLKDYCPSKYLGAFDEFVASWKAILTSSDHVPDYTRDLYLSGSPGLANLQSLGHHDMHVKLKEMDEDGVAAEVIFHSSENGQPMPFRPLSANFSHDAREDPELATVSCQMYNRWLADVCSIQPGRHAGLAYLPMWDVTAAVNELEWAREAGLRGINFPAVRADLPPYNDPVWEPLWDAAESLEMPLTTHIGGASPAPFTGVEAVPLKLFEDSHVFGYRAIHWLIFAGVFERHPRLKLIITEIAGDWFPRYMQMLDDAWYEGKKYQGFREQVPQPASEYCRRNIYFGASFMARFEAQLAVSDGYADRVMWGTDYPHIEGTWQSGFHYNGESATHLSLRNTFAGTPEVALRAMVGETAIKVYGLDQDALQSVATRIAAPTPQELQQAPDHLPKGSSTLAFRKHGTWT